MQIVIRNFETFWDNAFIMSEKKPKGIHASKPATVNCLTCGRKFMSSDKRRNRICPTCKGRKAFKR